MKIVLFSNSSWSIYNFRGNLIKKLLKNKHQIIILSSRDKFTDKLKKLGCKFIEIKLNNNKIYPLAEFTIILKIIYIFFKIKPDLILNFTIKPLIYGSFAANILSIYVINMITGLGTIFIKNNFLTKLVIKIYRVAFYNVNHVFFQNTDDQNIFFKNKIILKKKADLIPGSGVDLKYFKFYPLKKKQKTRFILISRILIEKGVIEYLNAAKKIIESYDCEFILVGSIAENNSSSISKIIIDDYVKKGIIKYYGFSNNVKKYINHSDCVVLPSYREGTPRILLEACSMGRPIITTNVPGCKNVVINGYNGFICSARSEISLKKSLLKFLDLNYNEKKKMSFNARKLVEMKYDEKFVIQKYLEKIKYLNEKKN